MPFILLPRPIVDIDQTSHLYRSLCFELRLVLCMIRCLVDKNVLPKEGATVRRAEVVVSEHGITQDPTDAPWTTTHSHDDPCDWI